MHYLLIDYENVQPDIHTLAGDFEIDVTVFVGPRQRVNRKIDAAIYQMDTRAEIIKVSCAGPNALDFHLAFHLGQMVMADPTATFEVVSNDKGYDSLITQLAAKGVRIQRSPGQRIPDGYKVHTMPFTPYYERTKDFSALPPLTPPVQAPGLVELRSPIELRGAIKSLSRRLAKMQAPYCSKPDLKRIERTKGRLAKLKRQLAQALDPKDSSPASGRPNQVSPASGRQVLHLPKMPRAAKRH